MGKRTKLIGLIVLVVVVIVSVFIWQSKQAAAPTQQTTPSPAVSSTTKPTTKLVVYPGVEGKSALTLLRSSHSVTTKSYEGLGELVTSIDGVTPDSKHFWAFYVNDAQSQVGADAYITKSTDTIRWKLEAIK